MYQIRKYSMTQPTVVLTVPAGSDLLDAQLQNDIPCLWFQVDPNEISNEEKTFHIVGTGQNFDHEGNWEYCATFQQGPFVWHLFEE